MLSRTRLTVLLSTLLIALLAAAVWSISPIRISIAVEQGNTSASANVDATATPVPPTAVPPTGVPPTAVPPTAVPPGIPPTATAVPPTATPVPVVSDEPTVAPAPTRPPQREQKTDPTPAPTDVPATAVPPTAAPENPNVKIIKSANQATVKPSEQITFTLLVQNTGKATARDVVVSDVVPNAFQVVDLRSSKGDVVIDGQTVTAYPSILAPGEQVTVTIVAKVREVEAGQYRNTAIITTSTPGDIPNDNTSTVTVTIETPKMTTTTYQAKPPVVQQPKPAPSRMPVTATTDLPTPVTLYGPWIVMAFALFVMAYMFRMGVFRQRMVTVQLPSLAAPTATATKAAAPAKDTLTLDQQTLIAQWTDGTTVADLTEQVVHANPTANRLAVSMAIRQMIEAHTKKQS